MSDNLISRQHVTYTIDKYISGFDAIDANFLDGLKTAKKLIKELPSAQPEHTETHSCDYERTATHGWIPVTEALPKEEDCPMDCLVTRKSKFIGNYTDMAVCEKNGTWTHEDWDAIVLGDVEDGKSTGLISTRDDNIIAWMPLPEPYKEEQDE